MTEDEFEVGIRKVEAALQGAFDPKFVLYLWRYFKDHEGPHWGRICSTLCQSSKPARHLVFRDFLQVGINERGRAHDRRKLEESREPRQGDIRKLDIVGIAEQVARRTGNPYLRDVAERMRKDSRE